ncbi:MAG: DegT/DnrJ/EryC1/StrS family aminotransferase [Candidatus Omnitrophica bacterium]|nr:DegT/DnrJ/EryC1/StrS family aminotransferase [Candidatus Omnitrophota bacterium]
MAHQVQTKQTAQRTIPLFWPYVSPKAAAALQDVLGTRWVGQGPRVERAEDEFRFRFNVPHAVSVNSCTSALHLALILAGVRDGDEVITTPLTCYATVAPILYQRAKPVFADIRPDDLNIDPEAIERTITDRTRAILPVHWAGEPCDLDEINAIARERGIQVIEDAAHALGAVYRGRFIGAASPFTCFSFQAIKQITTGDGGMLTVLDEAAAERARKLRWFGIDRNFKGDIYGKFQIEELGFKYHMNDLAAAILMVELEDLDAVGARRAEIVARYRQGLKDVPGVKLVTQREDRKSANWLFNILVERRADFQRRLSDFGIETSLVHIRCDVYPILGGRRQALPVMDALEPKYIALPLHCSLTNEDVDFIIDTIRQGW